MNPYESPKSIAVTQVTRISPAIVERLIKAEGTEDLVFCEVSDQQLYGRKYRQKFSGEIAKRAADAGCETVVYQSVLWWCLVYIPVVPLGVFAVIPKRDDGDPVDDGEHYRGICVDWDWRQIGLQYSITAGIIISGALIAYFWSTAL